ncbi:MAG: [FeFe] hydrogenase H-cluster maturation GTPase HydF [Clostridia bacterium]|nr:[FeFe] hydrogenase H-cluster maturation GTPase HydF [Clostridia bacterium]
MGLNDAPSSERIHIGFFGLMNVGKSSLINALTAQELSLVSDIPGTTTDPVRKAMELLPLGPVVIIDTAGFDDSGELGEKRVERTKKTLGETDIAVLVTEAGREPLPAEKELLGLFEEKRLPFVVAQNKADLAPSAAAADEKGGRTVRVSAVTGEGVEELKRVLGDFAREWEQDRRTLVADLLSPSGSALLVVPIDESAPKGRLILPQQQVMRELLDRHLTFSVCQPSEVSRALDALAVRPELVITDSQAFGAVSRLVPEEIKLTSFSILFARYKGELSLFAAGAEKLSELTDADRVLISEGCTHHRQCNDIGTVKLPGWIKEFCGARPEFEFTSGRGFPEDLSPYSLIVHCGGCMLGEREMRSRLDAAAAQGVPVVNYGMAIARMHGILKRSLEPFSL